MAFNTNGAATAGPKGLFSIDPLDVRLQVKTKAALNDIKAGTVYESIHVFCQEDKKFYTPKNYSTTAADANVTWEEVKYGGTWGSIEGTLSDQTDLNTELTNIKTDISNLQARGRFLSLWNAATGLPETNPQTDTYTYQTGDYFIVGTVATPTSDSLVASQTSGTSLSNIVVNRETYLTKVNPLASSIFIYSLISEEGEEIFGWKLEDVNVELSEYGITFEGTPIEGDVITVVYTPAVVNYKPSGASYTKDVASTVVETEELAIDDTYFFDGTTWHLQVNHGKTVSFANLAGQPSDNTNLANALNAKQDKLTSDNAGTNVTITTNESGKVVISATDTTYSQGTGITIDTNNQISANIATTSTTGIVKPDGVSITVDTDGTLKATAQETNYRGRWANYNAIPTDYTLYPEDSHGNKKPTYNDFVVVTDASDYVSPTNLNHGLRITNLHATKAFTLLVIDEFDTANEYYYNDGFAHTWKSINDYYSLRYDPGVPGTWYIKTNKPEDTKIIVKNETYNGNDGTVLCYTNEPATQFSAGLPGATGQFQGTWRFAYYSEWDVDGRAGWKPQYQIENTLPIATTTNPGIVKPDGTTITVDASGTLTATAQESHYRGKWNSWTDVPSVDTLYPEDYHGETTPTENDYIVVSNTSDFPVTDYNDTFEYQTDGYGQVHLTYQGETLHIPLKNGESFSWNNKVLFTNNATVCVPKNISGSAMKINDVVYQNNQNLPRALTQVKVFCVTPLQGSWRFAYHGTWDTDNKNGWTPEYQLEDVLPLATEQEAGIAKLYTTTGTNTDGSMDQNSITTALGNKQDTLTAGTGIDITNNTISIVAVEIRDYTSNQ